MAVIGIMDSGVGGLSVFREIRRMLPLERYIYFSDSAFCPYGEKDPEQIKERCRRITRELLERGAQIIVIACNTATAAAIQSLRSEFPVPFIGMEPAVKPAALGTKSGVVGVLATAGTLKGSKYLSTKGSVGEEAKIVESVGRGFVELVESGELEGERAETTVERSLRPLLDAGADTIVLGCTHYPFLAPVIQKIAGPGVKLIDPAPAVARHLIELLHEHGIPYSDIAKGNSYDEVNSNFNGNADGNGNASANAYPSAGKGNSYDEVNSNFNGNADGNGNASANAYPSAGKGNSYDEVNSNFNGNADGNAGAEANVAAPGSDASASPCKIELLSSGDPAALQHFYQRI